MPNEEFITFVPRGVKWSGNIFQKRAEEISRSGIPIDEIIKENLSAVFWKEIEREIAGKELVKIQITGKVRLGKSTLGIRIGQGIDFILKKHGLKDKNKPFDMRNVARDQNEYMKKIRNPDLMNDVIITDENNKSESTGENATVEQAQRETMSDVQAGRYIHSIFICPEGNMDKNTDIKIEVRNRNKGLVHTRVHYFMKSTLYYGWVLIGTADFDVSTLIRTWKIIEPRFMEFLKTKNRKEGEYIEYWAKRDFYVEYMCKKYEKMELMNREGIMHARDLDYAEIRKNVVDSLKPLASLTFINMGRLRINAQAKVETEFRNKKDATIYNRKSK